MQHVRFTEAEPLLRFLESNRDKIVGNTIRKFYSTTYFGDLTAAPVAFSLDGFDIVFEYFYYSDLHLHIAASGAVDNDHTLAFVYEGKTYRPSYHVCEEDFPYLDRQITDIEIARFSHAFEINPCTEEMRPEGGDYFSTITVHLDNGEHFYISGMSAAYDGYMSLWDDQDEPAEIN